MSKKPARPDEHSQARRQKQREEGSRAGLRAQGKLQEARDRWLARIVGEVAMDVLSCLQVNGAHLTNEAIRDDIVSMIADTLNDLSAETPGVEKPKTDEEDGE